MNEGAEIGESIDQKAGYRVLFNSMVIEDLKSINDKSREKIITAIKFIKYVKRPFIGKKLIGDLSEYYRHTIGKFVVLYKFSESGEELVILKIKENKPTRFKNLFY